MSCALGCRWSADVGSLCFRHLDRMRDMLDPRNEGSRFNPDRPDDPRVVASIPVLYGRLSAVRPSAGLSPLGPPAFGPSSPGDDHVLVLRDPRSRVEGNGPDDVSPAPRPPLVVLAALAGRVIEERGMPERGPALTVAGLSGWLYGATDFLAARPWVSGAWGALRGVSGVLRAATGDAPPASVGTCRVIVDDEGHEDPAGEWRCAAPLFVPEAAPRGPGESMAQPMLRCSSCGHRYTGIELVEIARTPLAVAS